MPSPKGYPVKANIIETVRSDYWPDIWQSNLVSVRLVSKFFRIAAIVGFRLYIVTAIFWEISDYQEQIYTTSGPN